MKGKGQVIRLLCGLVIMAASLTPSLSRAFTVKVTKTILSGCNVYAANPGTNAVSQYLIRDDGTLKAMTPPTVAAGASPSSVAVHPSAKYAYVVNTGAGTVSQYNLDQAGGAMVPMKTPTVVAGKYPTSISVDLQGRYAYVSAAFSVQQYSIDPNNGELTLIRSIPAGTSPSSVTVHPSGKYVYEANYLSHDAWQYYVDPFGVPEAFGAISTGDEAKCVAVDPIGRYAYVANDAVGTISQFIVGPNGYLMKRADLVMNTGDSETPQSIAFDPFGRYAYVASDDSGVFQYSIDDVDGRLKPLSPNIVGPAAKFVAVDPFGTHAYVAGHGKSIRQYSIGWNGSLTPLNPPSLVTGGNTTSIAIACRYVTVTEDENISRYFGQILVRWRGSNIYVPIKQIHTACPPCSMYVTRGGDIQEVTVSPETGDLIGVNVNKGLIIGYRGTNGNALPFKVGFTQRQKDIFGDGVLSRMRKEGIQLKGLFLKGGKIKGFIFSSKDLIQ